MDQAFACLKVGVDLQHYMSKPEGDFNYAVSGYGNLNYKVSLQFNGQSVPGMYEICVNRHQAEKCGKKFVKHINGSSREAARIKALLALGFDVRCAFGTVRYGSMVRYIK